ncbi:unnamed protein product [Enterobius vermicularis]|uniref:C-type lectin domain-containing protein n=1 Tax=Enterobius vermicularis TaxID=51028 RepID=A0A0N4UTN9_ENTVE|nr:unnamed protein product [Enterobius vermicularis]
MPSILSEEEVIPTNLSRQIFCFTYEILSGLSYNGFWSGHEKVGSGWRWLDGNQHNVTFWKSGHSKLDGRHVVVKKCGEWVSVDNETCAEAVCIIREKDKGDRRCAKPQGQASDRCYDDVCFRTVTISDLFTSKNTDHLIAIDEMLRGFWINEEMLAYRENQSRLHTASENELQEELKGSSLR